MRTWWRRIVDFLFYRENDRWLSVLRLGLGVEVASYCLSLRHDWSDFFSARSFGPINRDLVEAILSIDSRWIPRIGWLVDVGSRLGLAESTTINLIWWLLLGGSLLLIGGLFTRPTTVIVAFFHLCAVKSSGALTYGYDNFTTIGLFYLLISPLPDRLSLDYLWRRRRKKNPELLGFVRRALQLHVCLIYFFGGVNKCAGAGWWNGDSLWRALIRPPFNVLSPDVIVTWRWVLPVAGMAVCLLEISYPIFIWPRRTRPYWLFAIIAMHVGIGLLLGLYLFALAMIVLNVAAFGWWSRAAEVSSGQLLSTGRPGSETIG